MRLPDCFYQKAFWVVIPLLIVSFGSGVAAINAQITSLDSEIDRVTREVAQDNVPELKKSIEKDFDIIHAQLGRIEYQSMENYKMLCKITEGNC